MRTIDHLLVLKKFVGLRPTKTFALGYRFGVRNTFNPDLFSSRRYSRTNPPNGQRQEKPPEKMSKVAEIWPIIINQNERFFDAMKGWNERALKQKDENVEILKIANKHIVDGARIFITIIVITAGAILFYFHGKFDKIDKRFDKIDEELKQIHAEIRILAKNKN